jgi:hypothetical protein
LRPIASALLTHCSPSWKVCDYADASHKKYSRSAQTAGASHLSRGIIRHAVLHLRTGIETSGTSSKLGRGAD